MEGETKKVPFVSLLSLDAVLVFYYSVTHYHKCNGLKKTNIYHLSPGFCRPDLTGSWAQGFTRLQSSISLAEFLCGPSDFLSSFRLLAEFSSLQL